MRVVIIGAGFAGLMAADRVVRSGQQVVVLEARDRVGGRVWSQRLVPDDDRTVVERGGEFVLDGYELMRSVLADLGRTLADTAMSYYDREFGGGAPTTRADVADCARLVKAAVSAAGPGAILSEIMASPALAAVPAAARAAVTSRLAVTNGVSADVLTATALEDVTTSFDARPTWRVAGGNQLVATGLANRLGSALWLASPVRRIEHNETGVRVLTSAGEVSGDAVIVAVPLAVLRELTFSPELPANRRAAWHRAGIGHNAKLHVPLRWPAKPSAVQSVPGAFWCWTATDASGHVQPVLHAFGGTPAGLASLDVANGPASWAQQAAKLRPDLDLDLAGALLTTWNDDPWAGESYSAATTSVAPGDDELIASPAGRVHFAGEHTAGQWAGLMEGALRSGLRAADEVLAAYR